MEEGLSTTRSSSEARKRPKKANRCGSGNYCYVPNCKSTQSKVINKAKTKTGIAFFHFQKPKKKKGMASKYIQISAKTKER